jgi:hypothetical protein
VLARSTLCHVYLVLFFSFLDTSLLIDPFPIILYAYIGPLYENMVFVHEFIAAAAVA